MDMETVRQKVKALVDKAPLPRKRTPDKEHSQITKLLTADDVRAEKIRRVAYVLGRTNICQSIRDTTPEPSE
jgi:hypothetical protein